MSTVGKAFPMQDNGEDTNTLGTRMQNLGDKMEALGASLPLGKIIFSMLLIIGLGFFINFHAIYLQTGTPMLKYGIAMTIGQPFYSFWAMWKLISVYLIGYPMA